jgi:hypothetical protein
LGPKRGKKYFHKGKKRGKISKTGHLPRNVVILVSLRSNKRGGFKWALTKDDPNKMDGPLYCIKISLEIESSISSLKNVFKSIGSLSHRSEMAVDLLYNYT